MRRAWEVRIVGGEFDGARDIAVAIECPPAFLWLGRCWDVGVCGTQLGADAHPHTWFWIPGAEVLPSAGVLYELLESEPTPFEACGVWWSGHVVYVVSGVVLPG